MTRTGLCLTVILGLICFLFTNIYSIQKSETKNINLQILSTPSQTISNLNSVKHLPKMKYSLQNNSTLRFDRPNNNRFQIKTSNNQLNKTKQSNVTEYIEDFETNDGNYEPDPMTGAWEWGIPTSGPDSAHSGINLWATVLGDTYSNYVNWKLNSCDFQANEDNPEFRFWHWFNIEPDYDGGNLKLSIDGGHSWLLIEPQGSYPDTTSEQNAGIPSEPCFSGTTSDWEEAVFVLPVDSGQIFQLRWHFGSDFSVAYDGWYIDDVTGVGFNIVTIDHDVGATRILEPSGSVLQGSVITPKVIIQNFGINNEIFPVVMKISTVYCETLSNVSLNAGQIDTVEFPSWTATIGLFNTTAFTDLSTDLIRSNDTTHGSVAVLEFVQDFESNNGSYLSDPSSGAWEWGTPTSGPNEAHSGVNVWATVLAGGYSDFANWKLTSDGFQATQDNPELRFWHWYLTESYFDGGNVKISTDSGNTWVLIEPQDGYPDTASPGNSGIPDEPCYSGESNGWLEAIFVLPVNSGQVFELRWHFGSDGSSNFDGWYIDDVAGAGFHVGIAETSKTLKIIQPFLSVFPNPITRSQAKIHFGVKQAANVSISVFDASGRLVKNLVKGRLESGKYTINWNTNDETGNRVSNGIYLLVYRSADTKLTNKLILNK